jgi:hypothetical protein
VDFDWVFICLSMWFIPIFFIDNPPFTGPLVERLLVRARYLNF